MMKRLKVHFRIELLALAGAIVCALTIFIASTRASNSGAKESSSTPVAQSSQVTSEPGARTYEGVITDTHCGAKHSAKVGQAAADCTRTCVHSGARFALVDGDKMYVLEGEPVALKRAAGERVKIAGTLNGETISVTSVGAPTS